MCVVLKLIKEIRASVLLLSSFFFSFLSVCEIFEFSFTLNHEFGFSCRLSPLSLPQSSFFVLFCFVSYAFLTILKVLAK